MNYIKFLGTAGGRFAVINQFRKSGGIWISIDDTNILVDPGPGSLLNCLSSRPKLYPKKLDGIILSHSHIDHSNDINIMIEAMTNGGFNKKGLVFSPKDAIEKDGIIIDHFKDHVDKIIFLKEGNNYDIGNISFSTPIKNIHGVETYGLKFFGKDISLSIVTDTKYSDKILDNYNSDILILNVVLLKSVDKIKHLSIDDAENIIKKLKPKLTILTHFGMKVIKAKPWEIAEKLSNKLDSKVIAASDGMKIDINQYKD